MSSQSTGKRGRYGPGRLCFLSAGVHSVLAQYPHMRMNAYAFYYVNISTLMCSWNEIYHRIAFQGNMEKVSRRPMYISLSIEILVSRCTDLCILRKNKLEEVF